ncbi:His Kinase A (phospho-acceptor) domain-containing protein [Arboricoccus pini]|uniref:histidine kinase n=1 Tax=Arboricoccus pini TaxID=1963835 RepID=A0A212QWH5_9PROT|nr:ATP-binding protein [Arboricoccus pini]SNB64076.1 His Kinase A (phospho-acceptor) domain-containing protein [Arboricoccus pini]
MTIRRRIFTFVLVLCIVVAGLAVTALVGAHVNRHAMEAVEEATSRYRLTMQFATATHRYAEQTALLLLMRQQGNEQLEQVRNDVEVVFAQMQRHSQQFQHQRHANADWLEELDRLRQVFSKIDHAVERAALLNDEKAYPEAIQIFKSEIQPRLDADFRAVVARAVTDEEARVSNAEMAAQATSRRVTDTVIVVALVLILLMVIMGTTFARALLEPIDALTRGARAIEEGSLAHRIGLKRQDELGRLSQHFDRMAERLENKVRQLAEAQAGLEEQVRARTMELDRLNRQLTDLDRQRVRFLADISHEMRTPLTVLRGEAEVTLRGAERPAFAYREALERIVEEAAGMSRLIDDLLFLARSEMGEIRFDEQHVVLDDVVLGAIEAASVLAEEKGIALEFDGEAMGLAVRADPRRLRQVLLIVLDNAIKYSKSNARVQISMTTTKNCWACVSVEDQGQGIAGKDLPHVFERFYRGENGRREAPGGSGLGLNIARWIVEKHGGTIELDSQEGRGTRVDIHLPLQDQST